MKKTLRSFEKDLLLTDLLGRTNHRLYCALCGCTPKEEEEGFTGKWLLEEVIVSETWKDDYGYPCLCKFNGLSTPMDLNEIRPYLRRLSSMTESERNEFNYMMEKSFENMENIKNDFKDNDEFLLHTCVNTAGSIVDWLNYNHFDFRGLIDLDMAIEVTEENNPYPEPVNITFKCVSKDNELQEKS